MANNFDEAKAWLERQKHRHPLFKEVIDAISDDDLRAKIAEVEKEEQAKLDNETGAVVTSTKVKSRTRKHTRRHQQ